MGWFLGLASLLLFGLARPVERTMFDRMMVSHSEALVWDGRLLFASLGSTVLAMCAAVAALVVNLARPRARGGLGFAVVLLIACAGGLLAIVPRLS